MLCADPAIKVKPVVNQLALCVGYNDPGLIDANARRKVHVQVSACCLRHPTPRPHQSHPHSLTLPCPTPSPHAPPHALTQQAWSPLGNGRLTRFSRDAPEARTLCADIGKRYGKSPYQVALRWLTQSGASFTGACLMCVDRSPLGLISFWICTASFHPTTSLTLPAMRTCLASHLASLLTCLSSFPACHFPRAFSYLSRLCAPVEARSSAHFAEDLALFDFALSAEEMAALAAINKQPGYEGSITGPNA